MSDVQNQRGAAGRLDFLIGLIAMVGAALAVFWLIPAQIEASSQPGQLSPRFFPMFSAIIVGMFGVALIFKNRAFALNRVPHTGPRMLIETLAWALWAVVTMGLLATLGFVVTGALSCFAAMILAGQRSHLLWCGLASVALPIAIQQLAWRAFYIQLP